MDGIEFIQDLAIVLVGAGLAGALCKRIGLSVIVGYLLAGMAIGPYTPPFALVNDVGRIETLSQVGLVFLMFAIGLGLSLTRLQKMGLNVVLATALGAFFMLNLTRLLGASLDWSSSHSLFVAAMLMVSSSAVIAKVIKEVNLTHEPAGRMALGITVLEDVVAVVMLALLGSQAGAAATPGVGSLLTGLSAFVVLLVMLGLFFVPKLLRRLDAYADPELQTITVAGVLFLMAFIAVKAGYSLALGAFLLGAIVAEMPQKGGVEKAFTGMRDTFSSVFFVAIGMMIDLALLAEVWPLVLALTLFTLVARSLCTGLALMLVGTDPREARRASLALTPLGEFTFVIAQLGVAKQALPPHFYPVSVGVSILTVLLCPIINRHAGPLLALAEKAEPSWLRRWLETYHNWLGRLAGLQENRLWWQLSKKRLPQIGLELLLITGLLSFARPLLGTLRSAVGDALTPLTVTMTFWTGIGLLVLIPLLAMWRNLSVLAMIFAELAESRGLLPGPIVENGFKLASAVGIAYWLSVIVPETSLTRWAWLVIVAVLAVVLIVFSRRLVYWHSKWQGSLKEVLAEQHDGERQRQWMIDSAGWGLQIHELILPEQAACSGESIARLGIRSRFGCSVVEIERHGDAIIAPEPDVALYSGDRLLLLGTPEQIETARSELSRLRVDSHSGDFDEARLETVAVRQSPLAGSALAELAIPRRTGVLVVGIERDGARIVNPSGEEELAEGDGLLVLGTPGQIRDFRLWLSGSPPPAASEAG